MSTIFRFEVCKFPAVRVIGKLLTHSVKPGAPNPVPALWESMLREGTLTYLNGLPGCCTPDRDSVGWMGEYNPTTMGFTYIAGVLKRPGTPVPEGYAYRDLPECLMGIGWIRGRDEGGGLYASAHEHTERAMKESGYEFDGAAGGYEMEYYPYREFGAKLAAGAKEAVICYYSPCRPATGGTGGDGTVVLPGVPKIGFHIATCPFPGSLHSCMSYLGEAVGLDFLMGVTGAAFRRLWNRDDGGNVDLSYFAPEPYDRAFRALGYSYRVVSPRDCRQMIDAIKESIGRGVPLPAFGIIGPPECGLVTGYAGDGEELFGYSYFQDPSLPGYYRKARWYEEATWAGEVGLLVIDDRTERPPLRSVFLDSLRWLVELERKPRFSHHPDHVSGLAAYDAWADGLEKDEDYAGSRTLDDSIAHRADYEKDFGPAMPILDIRSMVHGDQAVMLEERKLGASYLRSMKAAAPEAAEELDAAAALYDEVAAQMGGIWRWGGNTMGPEIRRDLAEPSLRRDLARHVRMAREKEERAVERVERMLGRLS